MIEKSYDKLERMIHLQEPTYARIIQSGLFDSSTRGLTQSVPVATQPAAEAPKPKAKAVRKKKETEVAAPAPAPAAIASPETKAKVKAAPKKKEAPAPAPAPAPVSAPAPASVASASAAPAVPKSRAKFAKGSQEAKDHMAAIRAKRGAAKAAAVAKAGETPAHSDADDAAVVKKVSRKKKVKVKEEPLA